MEAKRLFTLFNVIINVLCRPLSRWARHVLGDEVRVVSELLDHPFCLFFGIHCRCCLRGERGHASGAARVVTTPSPLYAVSKRRLARAASLFFLVLVLSAKKKGKSTRTTPFGVCVYFVSPCCCSVLRNAQAKSPSAMSVYRVETSKTEPAVDGAMGTVNVLPTAVDFTGVVANGTSNWNSYRELDQDGSPVNYLRGRKLVGAPHCVPGHAAVVFERCPAELDGQAGYRSICVCDSVVLYEHQVKPSLQNDQVERLADWVALTSYISDV